MIKRERYELSIIAGTPIVLDRSNGVWSKADAEAHLADFKANAASLVKSGKPWAKLGDLSEWKASAPEAVDILKEHLKWAGENGMAYAAYIIPNPIERMQQQRIVRGGPLDGKVDYFASQAEALEWLKKKLA